MDIGGIKTGIKCLREDQQLMVFPEGTRVRPGKVVKPKKGALLLAARTDAPVLPVYLTVKRHHFSKLTCVIGKPYRPAYSSKKPSEEELETATQDLMEKIYRLGETA